MQVDIIQSSGTTHAYASARVSSGAGIDTIDGNAATYWQCTSPAAGGGGTRDGNLYSTHTFDAARDIDEVTIKMSTSGSTSSGASNNTASGSAKVEWYNGTVWATVTGSDISGSCGGDGSFSDSIDTTLTGLGLTGVEKIRAYGYSHTYRDCNPACGGSEGAETKIYELAAYINIYPYSQVIMFE